MKGWLTSVPAGNSSKIRAEDLLRLAAAIKPLSVADLIAAYGQTAPDAEYRPNAAAKPEDEVKRAVVEKALSTTAGAVDIAALLVLYDSRPLILSVFVDHPEWDSDSKLTGFLMAHLDQLADAYKQSDRAPTALLVLAARNQAPAIQAKLDSVLSDVTQNDGNYGNAHLYADLIYAYAQTANPTIAKHLPDIFAVLANRAKAYPSNVYQEVAARDVFNKIWWALQWGKLGPISAACPVLFSDQKSKDAVLKMADEAEGSGNNGMPASLALVPAAACGSKPALKKVVDLMGSPTGCPGPATMDRTYAKKYLETITCRRDGDKLIQIVSHIDDATYDPVTCLWTIPSGQ